MPVKHQPRRVAAPIKKEVRAKIEELEKQGILEKVTEPSDWISSMVVVKKPDKLRICLDPQDLNKALRRSHYILPTIEEILPSLSKAKYFSVLDAKDGFLQVQLDDESSKLTTFWTPFGRYKWLRMPFGITSAPEEYQRRLHELLHGLSGIEVVADDILVYGCGETAEEALKDHDTNLTQLLLRAREVNLKLNEKKFKLRVKEVPYIGHILTDKGVKADPSKIAAVLSMPTPQNVEEVQRIIGFVNYLSKFLPNLADVCKPLRELSNEVRNNRQLWEWEEHHEAAFKAIKQLASTAPVLRYYDVTEPVSLQCDASEYGLGATILQNDQPVAFASRALNQTERNYAQIEKECLAIVFACERFSQYLSGKEHIDVQSDHKPLETIFKKTILCAPKRLQRMRLRLQKFNINVKYKKGKEMYIADLLSRAIQEETKTKGQGNGKAEDDVNIFCIEKEDGIFKEIQEINMTDHINVTKKRLEEIQRETKNDTNLQTLKDVILAGWPNSIAEIPTHIRDYWPFKEELGVQNGVILKAQRVVIPKNMRPEMLTKIHASHLGIQACLRKAKDTLYWPRMAEEIMIKIGNCSVCNETAPRQQREPMITHPTPERPWQRIAMDIFTVNQRNYLVTVDYFSDFWELDVLKDTTAATIVSKCKKNFSLHGIPDILDSDQGTQIDCQEFRKFASDWEFEHCTSSPYFAQSNGKAESAVKQAKKIVKRTTLDKSDLFMAILDWRNTPTQNMRSSPVQRLMSRRTKTLLPTAANLLNPKLEENVQEKINLRKQKYKQQYDKAAKPLPELQFGQDIRVQVNPERRADPWRTGNISACLGSRSYIVEVEGHRFRRNRRHIRTTGETQFSEEDRRELMDQEPRCLPREEDRQILEEQEANRDQASLTVDCQDEQPRGTRRIIRKPSRYKDFVNK